MRISDYFNITDKTFKLCKEKAVSNSKNSEYWQKTYTFLIDIIDRDHDDITWPQKSWLINIKSNLEPDDDCPFREWKKKLKTISIEEALQKIEEGNKKHGKQKDNVEYEDDETDPMSQGSVSRVKDNFIKQNMHVKWKPEVDPEAVETPIKCFEPRSSKKGPQEGSSIKRDEMLKTSLEFDPITYKNTQEILDTIGEWGEKKVFISLGKYLKRKYNNCEFEVNEYNFKVLQGKNILAELNWLNKNECVQEGSDLILTENGITKYIEVKSTISDEIDVVELSGKQWGFLKRKGDNYIIYRVFRAGFRDARIEEIKNPYKVFMEGKLGVDKISLKL